MTEETDTPSPQGEEDKTISKEEVNPSSSPIIDNANTAAERLNTAAERMEKVMARAEALKVEDTLGGKASASGKKKELTDAEYAQKVMKNDIKTS